MILAAFSFYPLLYANQVSRSYVAIRMYTTVEPKPAMSTAHEYALLFTYMRHDICSF